MTFGSAALCARSDGLVEYLPPPPVDLLEAAFRAEIALQSGSQAQMVGRSMVVGGSLPCPEKSMEPATVSCIAEPKTLRERIATALRRRMYPNTNLHPKQLRHSIGVSENTLNNWLGAHHDMRGPHLMALIRFFDSSFAQEISEGHVTKITDNRAAIAIRKMADAQRELSDALGGKP